ncbi:MAG: chemotaxis protein CheW, partial [Bacillota bacterium]
MGVGSSAAAGGTVPACGGKYLTFALGKEEYGLEILKVREIIGYMEITAVPRTPGY